jgi:4-diphosphocytidyl-2-C-methyl-D-erythritol kinase
MKFFEKLKLNAYAKVNISLDITGVFANGMHQVETVMHTINLADVVSIELNTKIKTNRQIFVSSNKYFIPTSEKNLAHQAATVVLNDFPHRKEPIYIHLKKNVPVGAGLVGGSSDAATTIKGINQLLRLGLTHEKMEKYAAKIGSDVPFLLGKGACLATGTGTDLRKIPSINNCSAVLVNPGIFVSTKDVYALYDSCDIPADAHPNTTRIIEAIEQGNYAALVGQLKNVLEIPVFKMHSQIAELKTELIKAGCDTALMSGSGSTVYGLSQDCEKLEAIKKMYIDKGYKAFVVNFIG